MQESGIFRDDFVLLWVNITFTLVTRWLQQFCAHADPAMASKEQVWSNKFLFLNEKLFSI